VTGAVVQCAPSTAPGSVGVYTAVGGNQYSTTNGGAVNVEIDYILPETGGIVVGTFSGSMVDETGANVTISLGSFILPIE
jgi:hypothetical protein